MVRAISRLAGEGVGENQPGQTVVQERVETCGTILFDAARVIFGSAWKGYRDVAKTVLSI